MNKRILIIAASLIACAFAAEAQSAVLLDCNTASGPDQQIIVVQDDYGQLILRELTNSGNTVQRALPAAEWSSGTINLRQARPGEKATLTKSSDGWYFTSHSFSMVERGYADCR